MSRMLGSPIDDDSTRDLMEEALLVALVTAASAATLSLVGDPVAKLFRTILSSLG